MSNLDWESDYRIKSRVKTVALGYVDISRHIKGLLKVTQQDPYLLALTRYAVYKGLEKHISILKNKEEIREFERVRKEWEDDESMEISELTIPVSPSVLSEEDRRKIEDISNYKF